MKFVKKRVMSLLLVLAMALALTDGVSARAGTSTAVTLRVEKDASTELAPVSVTLTDADKKDFGIGLGTETLTPLHALAKYLQTEKNVADADMGKYIIASSSAYGLYVTGISVNGDGVGSAAEGQTENVFWNYRVNDAYVDVGMDACALKDGDSVVFYGMWSPFPAEDEVLYTHFEKAKYSAAEKEAVTVTLNGSGVKYDENSAAVPYSKPVKGATVTATEKGNLQTAAERGVQTGSPAESSNPAAGSNLTAQTDEAGRARLVFDKAGTYVLSAWRRSADGVHMDISRPYAEVTVTEAAPPAAGNKVKVPKPSKVKVSVKKSKAAKKKITVTWKKAKGTPAQVSGYEIALSKKKKKGYKRIARTKKTKTVFRKGKGKYYIKVRAYKTGDGKAKAFSAYTAPVSVRVR